MEEQGLTRLEDLMMAIHQEMDIQSKFWISIQPNTMKDFQLGFPPEWPSMINKMKVNLQNSGFYIPEICYNLRNSSDVYSMVEAAKSDNPGLEKKDCLGIPTISMTIHSTTPKEIPILKKEYKNRIGDAILFAIKKTKEEINLTDSSFVILHDNLFKTDEIYDALKAKMNPNDIVLKYPPNQHDKDPSIAYLEDLMENKIHGSLILKDKGFKGGEAQNVILILQSSSTTTMSDVRCNMLRCISNLSIINVFNENEGIKFDKTRVFGDFSSCKNECTIYIYECHTCKEESKEESGEQNKRLLLCLSCTKMKKCHGKGHSFKRLSVKNDLKCKKIKCGCDCNI